MDTEINQIPSEAFSISNESYYVVDFWNGSAFETKKVSHQTLFAIVSPTNIYNSDDSIATNRNVNLNGKKLRFIPNATTGGQFLIGEEA